MLVEDDVVDDDEVPPPPQGLPPPEDLGGDDDGDSEDDMPEGVALQHFPHFQSVNLLRRERTWARCCLSHRASCPVTNLTTAAWHSRQCLEH